MTRYRLFSIIICLALFNHVSAQQPSYLYGFKLMDKKGKPITDADSVFSISSIKPDGSFYRPISYRPPNKIFAENWVLYEYYQDVREFHLIQILNRQSRDTMTLFYRKYNKYSTYEGSRHAFDTIRFSKGYYILHDRPLLKDWENTDKSKKLTVLHNRTDFLNYIAGETNGVKPDSQKDTFPVYKSKSTQDVSPESIALSRFTGLVFPVYNGEKTGKIVVRFFADKDGRITDAIPSVKGTTLYEYDENLQQKCKEAIMKSRLLQEKGNLIESGTVVFQFKSKGVAPK